LVESSNGSRPFALLMLGSIYRTHFQDGKRAREMFARLVSEFPDHPYEKVAKRYLDNFNDPEQPIFPQHSMAQADIALRPAKLPTGSQSQSSGP
jgi:hypothetical protein